MLDYHPQTSNPRVCFYSIIRPLTLWCNDDLSAVITLVPGRPQAGAVRAGEMKYYTVRSQSDTAKLIVSFTSRVGVADLYIRIGAGLIDPEDVTTYRCVNVWLSLA